MGQYHIIANLDKQEVIVPWDLNWGAKQKEHTGFAGSAGDAIYLLTQTSPNRGGGDYDFYEGVSGRWAGDRVVVLGDYTEPEEDKALGFDLHSQTSLYRKAFDEFENISGIIKPVLEQAFEWQTNYHKSLYAKAQAWDDHLKELALAE